MSVQEPAHIAESAALQILDVYHSLAPTVPTVYTCDGGALMLKHLADLAGIPARLEVGLYWHTDPTVRAAQADWDPDEVDDLLDEHHHWVVLWPGEANAVLLDPNGPERREPYLQSASAADAYVPLGADSEDRYLAYDPDQAPLDIAAEDAEAGNNRLLDALRAAETAWRRASDDCSYADEVQHNDESVPPS